MLGLFLPFLPAHVTCCMWLCKGRLGTCTRRIQTQHQRTQAWQHITARQLQLQRRHTKLLNALITKAQCNLYICRPVCCPPQYVNFCLFQKFEISEASQREEKKQKTTGKSWTETKRTSRRIRLITTYIKYTLCSDRELSPRFLFFFCSLLPPSGRCKKLQRLVWYLPRLLLCSLNPAAPALRLRANTVCKQLEVFAFLHFWHQPQGEGKKKAGRALQRSASLRYSYRKRCVSLLLLTCLEVATIRWTSNGFRFKIKYVEN